MQDKTSHTDEVLLRRIVAGEQEALGLLYDRYGSLVYALLMGIVRNVDDAEDLMQEVFTQVWLKADTYQSAFGNAKNWVLRIAHNRAVNHVRSRRVRETKAQMTLESIEQVAADPNPSTLSSLGHADEVQNVNRALARLPEEQRILVTLAFLQGLSHTEIAEQLDIPLGTVKSRIRAGLKSLRTQLDRLSQSYTLSEVSSVVLQSEQPGKM